jgi:hypothetical protein
MVPDASSPSTLMDVEWINGAGTTVTSDQLTRDVKYDIVASGNMSGDTFSAEFVGLSSSGVPEGAAYNQSFTGILSSGDGSLGEAGITWDPQTPGVDSSDAIIFNNYTVVPEPGTLALIPFSVLVLGVMKRYRKLRA